MILLDSWRLAVGTLTAIPVRPPAVVDRRRAGLAMVLAPLAVLPLGAGLALVAILAHRLGLPDLVAALLAVGVAVLGNRAFHLDGLSDTVDGMAASYDRARSLEVMKGGTAGPAGVVAIVLVLGLQVAALSSLVGAPFGGFDGGFDGGWFSYRQLGRADYLPADSSWVPWHGPVLAGVALCVSRAALLLCCVHGVVPAREDGLGRTYTQTVPRWVAAVIWCVLAVLVAVVARWAGLPPWRGALAVALAAVAAGLVVMRSVRRFGGVTGDVFGASIELAFATLLVALT